MVPIQLLTSLPITLCCSYVPPIAIPAILHPPFKALEDILSNHQPVIIVDDFRHREKQKLTGSASSPIHVLTSNL